MKQILRTLYIHSSRFLTAVGFGKSQLALSCANFLKSKLKTNIVEVHGNKIFLDSNDSLKLSFRNFEESSVNIIKKLIKKGDVVVDIGANIGFYTLLFSKLVGNKGKVFAFEPEPNNFKLLKRNIEENNIHNVFLIKKGVSNSTSIMKLFTTKNNCGWHSLIDVGEDRTPIDIDTVKLDDYFKNNFSKISFIKMDIEGGEPQALQGMQTILKYNQNIKIMTEFHPFYLEKAEKNPNDFLKMLKKYKFKIFEIKDKQLTPFNEKIFLTSESFDMNSGTNLFCIKTE